MKIDIVIGLQYGDEAKGKVTHSLCKKNHYDRVLRVSSGANCGHTIYHEGKKLITHIIPAGVFYGIRSIISPACVLNVKSFFEEIRYLEENGIKNCQELVRIAKNAHVVTENHIEEDAKESRLGTTKRGIGPCQRDRYNRTGIQAKEIPELRPFLIDFYEEMFTDDELTILSEGAQGHNLDILLSDRYPYVTSGHCGVSGVLINGLPHSAIRSVYGVAKAYSTYVGADTSFHGKGEIFDRLQEVGKEIGATTKRKRQCNYLNVSELRKAIQVNAVTHLIVNKVDVLQELNVWRVIDKGEILDLDSEENFKNYLKQKFVQVPEIIFSYSPEEI
mgnify:CR=1 FL=1